MHIRPPGQGICAEQRTGKEIITMTNLECINILSDIANELKTQSYDKNPPETPVYWTAQTLVPIHGIDPYEAEEVRMAFNDDVPVAIDKFKAVVIDKLRKDFAEDHHKETLENYIDELKDLNDFDSIKNFCEEVKDYHGFGYDWNVNVTGIRYEWRDIQNNIFLTKRDAESFKDELVSINPDKEYGIHAHTSKYSSDLKGLIDALKNMDWDKLWTEQ